MKLQLSILLLAAVAECNPQFGKTGTAMAYAGKTVGKPVLRPNAKRETLKYGPIELYAKNVGNWSNARLSAFGRVNNVLG
jgi:hypothetical protein